MRKKILNLTPDQVERGVIFSSNLVGGGKVHAVFEEDNWSDSAQKIRRLLDDKFFDNSPYKYNEIRCTEAIRKLFDL